MNGSGLMYMTIFPYQIHFLIKTFPFYICQSAVHVQSYLFDHTKRANRFRNGILVQSSSWTLSNAARKHFHTYSRHLADLVRWIFFLLKFTNLFLLVLYQLITIIVFVCFFSNYFFIHQYQLITIYVNPLITKIKKNKIVTLLFNMGLNIFTNSPSSIFTPISLHLCCNIYSLLII